MATKKTTKKTFKPDDLVAVVTASHQGLFTVAEADDDTVVVRDPASPGTSFRIGRNDIKGGPWRPV